MRVAAVALALFSAAAFVGCTSSDNPNGHSTAREAGHAAYEASQKAKEAAEKAAQKLHQAGKEAAEGWRDAQREERTNQTRESNRTRDAQGRADRVRRAPADTSR